MSETPVRLLVVDDEMANRTALSRRLARKGYEVDTAEGGAQALDKILRDQYDLILLDQMMPGMSGLDLLRLLRATYSPTDLPVIMVTALDEKDMIVRALEEGANDYLVKPVETPEITARIQAQLARSKSSRKTQETPPARVVAAAGSGPDGSWDWDPVTRTAHFSRRWKEILGYSEEEVGNDLAEWLDRIHPHDLVRVRKQLNAHMEGVEPEFYSEHRLLQKHGTYRWVLCRGLALRSEDGLLIRMAGCLSDIEERKGADPLTGLANRQQLLDKITEIQNSKHAQGLALLVVDLDEFHAVNERSGHEAGDRVLMEVAQRLREAVASSRFGDGSVVSRLGGDVFALLVRCPGGTCDIGRLADAVLEYMEPPVEVADEWLRISASIGVVISSGSCAGAQDLLRDADLAMYQAKERGKSRWHLFEPSLRDRAKVRTLIARDLRYAVERNELVVVYQPQVHLQTRAVLGFEALLRWRHPELGMVMPSDFIPVAEETGLIVPAGEWILRQACSQLARWQKLFPNDPPLSMSVNLSVRQLSDSNLPNLVRQVLDGTGIAPETLTLELTESSLVAEKESARCVLGEIHAMGVSLKLDDFGTGYASLSYLNLLKFDGLKIDRSFVSKLETDDESRAIVRTIIGLARELRMGVIAEGIETEAEGRRLLEMGCEIGQGYYFSMPIESEAAEDLLYASVSEPAA